MIIQWINEDVKYCTAGKHFVPISMFGKHRYQEDGLNYNCKTCERIRQRLYYKDNRDARIVQHREYYIKNKSLCNIRTKSWARKNPKRYWAANCLRSHSKYGIDIKISIDDLANLAHTSTHCRICKTELDYGVGNKDGKMQPNSPTLDRINNENVITNENIWIICSRCNATKLDRTLSEFIDYCQYIVDNKTQLLEEVM